MGNSAVTAQPSRCPEIYDAVEDILSVAIYSEDGQLTRKVTFAQMNQSSKVHCPSSPQTTQIAVRQHGSTHRPHSVTNDSKLHSCCKRDDALDETEETPSEAQSLHDDEVKGTVVEVYRQHSEGDEDLDTLCATNIHPKHDGQYRDRNGHSDGKTRDFIIAEPPRKKQRINICRSRHIEENQIENAFEVESESVSGSNPRKRTLSQMQRELNYDERYSNLLEKWEAEKREIVKVKKQLMKERGEKEIVEK